MYDGVYYDRTTPDAPPVPDLGEARSSIVHGNDIGTRRNSSFQRIWLTLSLALVAVYVRTHGRQSLDGMSPAPRLGMKHGYSIPNQGTY